MDGCIFKRHRHRISYKVSRPVHHIRVVSFNAHIITHFFAQVSVLFQSKSIKSDQQIVNLDETGFTRGRDIHGTSSERVVTVAARRATQPHVSFRYNNRISLLLAIFADGCSVLPAVVVQGKREPTLSDFGSVKKVTDVVYKSWKVYWRSENASVETVIFPKWVHDFIPRARERIADGEWIVLFYNVLRAHMTCEVINLFNNNMIAVMELPAHTSDHLQPLDVSVFGPLKHYVNQFIEEACAEARKVCVRASLDGIPVWDAIYKGYGKALAEKNVK